MSEAPTVFQRRIVIGAAMCVAAFALVGIRLVDVTLLKSMDSGRAPAQTVTRADLTDRNGELLARDLPVNDLYARPATFWDKREAARDLAQATGAGIRAAADWLVAHSTDGTTAVFYYAGHVDKLSRSTEAIRGSDLAEVTDADLAAHFSQLHARAAWFTIAGCFGGGFNELLGPGRILTAASDANSLSYENETFGRSYLDEYMVRRGMLLGAADSSA